MTNPKKTVAKKKTGNPTLRKTAKVEKRISKEHKKRNPVQVGARNPFAVAEAVNKAPINWELYDYSWMVETLRQTLTPKKPRNKRPRLQTMLSEALSFEKLFDPTYNSRVYTRQNTSGSSPHVGDTGNAYELMSTSGCEAQSNGKKSLATNNYARITESAPVFGVPRVDAPIQGCPADCWLIAALSSVAWVDPDIIQRLLWDLLQLKDFDPNSGDPLIVVDTNPSDDIDWKPDITGFTIPAFARSKYDETWPAIYENYVSLLKATPRGSIPRMDYGDPQWACFSIDERTFGPTEFKEFFTSYPSKTIQEIGDLVWNELTDTNSPFSVWADASFLKTNYPTVTWTYYASYGNLGGAPTPGVVYDLFISANHGYSVLGTKGTNTPDDPGYIILRNPWAGTFDTNCLEYYLPVPKAAARTYKIAEPLEISLYGDYTNYWQGNRQYYVSTPYNPKIARELQPDKVLDGIFGIEVHDFVKYFAGYAWVT